MGCDEPPPDEPEPPELVELEPADARWRLERALSIFREMTTDRRSVAGMMVERDAGSITETIAVTAPSVFGPQAPSSVIGAMREDVATRQALNPCWIQSTETEIEVGTPGSSAR
jgi:hypothetical protein